LALKAARSESGGTRLPRRHSLPVHHCLPPISVAVSGPRTGASVAASNLLDQRPGLGSRQRRDLGGCPALPLRSARRGRSSPTLRGWRWPQRYAGRRQTDCRRRTGSSPAKAHHDATGQDSHKQQQNPGMPLRARPPARPAGIAGA
jgi:hypothetical protein